MIRPAVAASAALLAGFAELSLELAAVRLFAPHFGDSAPVWTNVIGVMLAALALGAWLGGRLADGARGAERLAALLLAAGLLASLAPLLSGVLGDALVPDDLPLDSAMGTLVGGSLVGTLLLFAPPVLLAGAVTPLLVTGVHAGGRPVGRASGLVATWSILGGLLGTFATTHLLVPGVGSRATVWIAAGALLVAGGLCAGSARRLRQVAGAAAVVLGMLTGIAAGGGLPPLRAARPGEQLVAEVETRYQYLQVVDVPGVEAVPTARLLRINEGLDSFHSVRIEGSPWAGEGRYYDWHVVTPWLAGDGGTPPDLRVLSLGAAAGTFERIFQHAHPGAFCTSVEIDPAVVEVGREDFGAFDGDRSEVYAGLDARVFVERSDQQWDVILVDAYERQMYVPAHVASVEFFRAVQARLRDGGVVSVNVGGLSFEDPVLRTIAVTMASVFGSSHALRVPSSRNFVLVARQRLPFDASVLAGLRSQDPVLAGILAKTSEPTRWRAFSSDEGAVLRDDRPFLDRLQERAYGGVDGIERLAMGGGDLATEAAVEAVQAAAAAEDWDRVLELCQTAAEERPWLRLMAGDARWRRGDYFGARAEYARGRQLGDGVDEPVVAALDSRLEAVAEPAARLDAAASSAWRNRLLALGAAALIAGGAWLVGQRAAAV